MNRFEKRVLQAFGDGTTTALSDGAIVDFSNGCYFGGRAGEESFVRDIDVVARLAA